MNQQFITQLPLTYVDSVQFENIGTIFQLKLLNHEQNLLVLLKNILHLNFSKDSLRSDDDFVNLIEITHEYRIPNSHDLRNYTFYIDINKLSPLNIITLYGNTTMEIICEEIEVKESTFRN
ncbi:hypothetical protein FEV09_23290 [Pseudanabaena catenata USMAC16]|uniref:Uncharacterized protein n=2 Tax=Pseudanabaena TaxID=1152 RepID=L8MQV5_9CYAN|nr:hypothetical protein [Pseudanabaena catenata]ELS30262.1 hypothetical protein Pse7429DRAFT_4639 [Pseudanabaena biceps PCC 7429]MDG3497452.1 hypothetical protein [Pseudanabaena catenata USMAC16]